MLTSNRHPASGYIQGINDIAAHFIIIFLCEHFPDIDEEKQLEPENFEEELYNGVADIIEADTYYCLTGILTSIKNFYTEGFPGINKSIAMFIDLLTMIDKEFIVHLEKNNIQAQSFAFRWMCCLLLREFPVNVSLR